MAKNTADWGRDTARKRYDSGGTVEPLRISPEEMTTRFQRMQDRGILNNDTASDFAAARMRRLGKEDNWIKGGGKPARYSKGGKAHGSRRP